MYPFKNVSRQENEALLILPVYISLLAANGDGKLDEAEKISAVGLAHLKTLSDEPLLTKFFMEVDRSFEKKLAQTDSELPGDRGSREALLKLKIEELEKIVARLGKHHSRAMHECMTAFTRHVSKAHYSVLVDFVFPVPIPGFTD